MNFFRRFQKSCFIYGQNFIAVRLREGFVIRSRSYYVRIILVSWLIYDFFHILYKIIFCYFSSIV